MRKYRVDEETARVMVAKYRERYRETGLSECAIYPGVAELVRDLRAAGRTVAVATGKPTDFTTRILKQNGLANLFDSVLGSELDGTRSQKWEVIDALLQKYGREDVVMVGDRDNDVLGAKKCGIPCIGAAWGYAEPGELVRAGAVRVARTAEELRKILLDSPAKM